MRLRKAKGCTVHLNWVKAHAGTFGNELVDEAAKAGTKKVQVNISCGIPVYTLKSMVIGVAVELWQKEWDEVATGRSTHVVYPKVSTKTLSAKTYINQVITEHGPFPSYFQHFNIRTDAQK